ncbi:hypothetical protein Slala02_10200 [Streptomyces lavendulae subsp. lavendulae]|nr:hypothetical protein Slala01_02240 [Streptomyces lavendulae subsp. lavendulae]GLX25200.1 hypothetical protein Slala02_10200 [Streptomyces lavendulae subsp. lavendulae]
MRVTVQQPGEPQFETEDGPAATGATLLASTICCIQPRGRAHMLLTLRRYLDYGRCASDACRG